MEAEGPVGAKLPHTWRRGLHPGWGTHKQARSKETPATFTQLKNQSRNRLPLGNKVLLPNWPPGPDPPFSLHLPCPHPCRQSPSAEVEEQLPGWSVEPLPKQHVLPMEPSP